MRIEKEGLYTYLVDIAKKNDYYRSTEFPMIRNNMPSTILPVHMRKKDGVEEIYYDVTGKMSLKEWGEKKQIQYPDIYLFLKSVLDMFETLDEYMLSPSQVVIDITMIFIGSRDKIQWMYGPGMNGDVQKRFEEVFLWILSRADFGDLKGAALIHKAYDKAKNEGICKEFLKICLGLDNSESYPAVHYGHNYEQSNPIGFSTYQNQPDRIEKVPCIGEDSILGFYEGEKQKNVQKGKQKDSKKEKKKDKKKRNENKKENPRSLTQKNYILIFFKIVLSICDLSFVVLWGYGLYRYGFQKKSAMFLGLLIMTFILLMISWISDLTVKKTKASSKANSEGEEKPKERFSTQKRKNNQNSKSIFEELEEHWEEGNHTILLSDGVEDTIPVLYNIKTNQVVSLKVFPFFIGSEEGLNQLSINNRTISRQHAVIAKGEQGDYYIEDLQSKNGTKIDGHKIFSETPVNLKDGTKIEFSNESWMFYLDIDRF